MGARPAKEERIKKKVEHIEDLNCKKQKFHLKRLIQSSEDSKFGDENKDIIRKAGAIPVVCLVLDDPKPKRRQYALKLLWSLCNGNKLNQDLVRSEGSISKIVKLSEDSGDEASPKIRRNALGAVWALAAKNNENKMVILDVGAVTGIVAHLTKNCEIQRRCAAGCVWALACDNREAQETFRRYEAIPLLLPLLSFKDCRKEAAAALWALVARNDANQLAVENAGGVALLKACVAQGKKDVEKAQVEAEKQLKNSDSNKKGEKDESNKDKVDYRGGGHQGDPAALYASGALTWILRMSREKVMAGDVTNSNEKSVVVTSELGNVAAGTSDTTKTNTPTSDTPNNDGETPNGTTSSPKHAPASQINIGERLRPMVARLALLAEEGKQETDTYRNEEKALRDVMVPCLADVDGVDAMIKVLQKFPPGHRRLLQGLLRDIVAEQEEKATQEDLANPPPMNSPPPTINSAARPWTKGGAGYYGDEGSRTTIGSPLRRSSLSTPSSGSPLSPGLGMNRGAGRGALFRPSGSGSTKQLLAPNASASPTSPSVQPPWATRTNPLQGAMANVKGQDARVSAQFSQSNSSNAFDISELK